MIKLEDAKSVIQAAVKKAVEVGQPMDIAVVHAGGNLVTHAILANRRIRRSRPRCGGGGATAFLILLFFYRFLYLDYSDT